MTKLASFAKPAIRKNGWKLLKYFLSTSFIAWFVYWLYGDWPRYYNYISQIDCITISLATVSVLMQWVIRGSRDQAIYKALGYKTRCLVLLSLYAKQSLLNYLPLKVGTAYLAIEKKRIFGIKITSFSYSFFAQTFLGLAIACIVSSFLVRGFNFHEEQHEQYASVTLLVFGIISIALIYIPIPKYHTKKFAVIRKSISSFALDARKFKNNLCLQTFTASLTIATLFVYSWRIQLIFISQGVFISLGDAFVFSTIITLSMLISISPAGLGFREAMLAVLASIIAIEPSSAVLVSAVDRIIVLATGLGVLCIHSLFAAVHPVESR